MPRQLDADLVEAWGGGGGGSEISLAYLPADAMRQLMVQALHWLMLYTVYMHSMHASHMHRMTRLTKLLLVILFLASLLVAATG